MILYGDLRDRGGESLSGQRVEWGVRKRGWDGWPNGNHRIHEACNAGLPGLPERLLLFFFLRLQFPSPHLPSLPSTPPLLALIAGLFGGQGSGRELGGDQEDWVNRGGRVVGTWTAVGCSPAARCKGS